MWGMLCAADGASCDLSSRFVFCCIILIIRLMTINRRKQRSELRETYRIFSSTRFVIRKRFCLFPSNSDHRGANPHYHVHDGRIPSSTMPSTLDNIFRLLQEANELEEKKENRIEAATKVRMMS